MTRDERESLHPVVEAQLRFEMIRTLGGTAMRLENEISEMRKILEKEGSFEAPDDYCVMVEPAAPDFDEMPIEIQQHDTGSGRYFPLDRQSSHYRREIKFGRFGKGKIAYVGQTIELDTETGSLWVYRADRDSRALYGLGCKITLASRKHVDIEFPQIS